MDAFPSQAWQIWVIAHQTSGVFWSFFQMNFVKFPVVQVLSEHVLQQWAQGRLKGRFFLEAHVTKGDMTGKWENGRRPKMQPFPTISQMIDARSSHVCAWKWRNFDIRGGGGYEPVSPSPFQSSKKWKVSK